MDFRHKWLMDGWLEGKIKLHNLMQFENLVQFEGRVIVSQTCRCSAMRERVQPWERSSIKLAIVCSSLAFMGSDW